MNQRKLLKKTRAISIILCLASIFLFACSDQKSASIDEVQQAAEKQNETEKVVYKEEIFGDPEIFKEPRFQFVWQAPLEKEESIWSTKLDGSDLRRVLSPELLFQVKGVIAHTPVRSPDNRYLAVSIDSSEVMGTIKVLYDLKEKSVTELGRGAFVPEFQWTSNGEWLYYHNDTGFWKYSISKKENIKPPQIDSTTYIINNDKFVSLHSRYYTVYSSDGRELFSKDVFTKRMNIGRISPNTQTVSKDGSLIFCLVDGNKNPFYTLFNLKDPNDVLYKSYEGTFFDCIFSPNRKKLFFIWGMVKYLDLETKEIKEVFDLPKYPMWGLTIFSTGEK